MQAIPDAFHHALADLRLALEPATIDKLRDFLAHLLEVNEVMNLTAVRGWEEGWTRHLLDSLAILPHLPEQGRLLDVGSGGGLPAIPIAIARPGLSVTLLEATAKKCRFLEDAAARLGLTNARVWNGRAETAGHDPALRETFDVCTARAVGAMRVLAEYTLPFLRRGGELVAMKGSQAEEECAAAVTALRRLGGSRPVITRFDHPLLPGACVVRVRKEAPTPALFPRAPGKPASDPL
jgi:16S rRNA (guanine527-N7)-methyltransferase